MKSIFIDCNDQLDAVFARVYRPDDPPIMVNTKPVPAAELPRLIDGYEICLDDHSYMPTDMVAQCRALKHIVFLGTGASSYMDVPALEGARRHRPHHQGLRRPRGGRARHRADVRLRARARAHGPRRARRHLGTARRRAAARQDPRRGRARRHRRRGRAHRARHRHGGDRLEPHPAGRRALPGRRARRAVGARRRGLAPPRLERRDPRPHRRAIASRK